MVNIYSFDMELKKSDGFIMQDAKNKNVENIVILSGDHLYRMDYMDFVQVPIRYFFSQVASS